MQYDVFICHASEDKDDFVRPLAELLRQHNITVWYDEFSLTIGDSLRQKIDEGLASSNFAIVVLSPNFFKKPWTNRELNGLTSREMVEQKEVILPIWHRVTVQDVAKYSPPLADKVAVSSDKGINVVIRTLTQKIKPSLNALVVAKDHLTSLGVETPSITDEWWLEIVEFKEMLKYPDVNSRKRWIFPLPNNDDRGYDRGMNIANAALQLDWSFEGEELNIGPTTHPDDVHAYLRRWPELIETARDNPEILALYVPQITISGLDEGLADIFDELLEDSPESSSGAYSHLHATEGKEPLCPGSVAMRHPDYGNYKPTDLARWYFKAHNYHYIRSFYTLFEGLIWLLSPDADWMPTKHRHMLISGIKANGTWVSEVSADDNRFVDSLYDDEKFELTPPVMNGLYTLVSQTLLDIEVEAETDILVDKLVATGFIQDYFDYWAKIDARRKARQV